MRKVSKRILTLYFLGVIAFFLARIFFVPPTFGEAGWFRNESVVEIASLDTKMAGSSVCIDCHAAEYAEWSAGEHRKISCESCHGLLKSHAENPAGNMEFLGFENSEGSVGYNSTIEFCLSCHERDASKPPDFPQIDVEHSEGWNCVRCHSPHNPVMG